VVAIITFGASEVVSQATVVARTILAATRIAAIFDRLAVLARDAIETVAAVAGRIAEITRGLNPLLTSSRLVATTETVEAIRAAKTARDVAIARLEATIQIERVPLKLSRVQTEKKFKHAADFGVSTPKGRAGYAQWERTIETFVHDPDTVRVVGWYHDEPAILNYNTDTRLLVIEHVDGTFWSGWRMGPAALRHAIIDRRIGGG
jgi:hypothetical protein